MGNIKKSFSILFSPTLWKIDTSEMSTAKRKVIRFFKLVRVTISTFFRNRMGFQCVALSYFVALAIVPLMALVFAVTDGLGLSGFVYRVSSSIFPFDPDAAAVLMEKAGNIINTAKAGPVGLISALLFLWTIIWLMFQTERVFNNVWGIRKVPRKFYKRLLSYMVLMLAMPFLFLTLAWTIAYYSTITVEIGVGSGNPEVLPQILMWLAIYTIAVIALTLMYKFIPATNVKTKWAFRSAVFAAIFFCLFQYVYLETQSFMNGLDAVYGALAAIPLLLMWMNFNWQIIIYGAELCYSYHHVNEFNIPEWKDLTGNG